MHQEVILQTQDLKKHFGAVPAVDGVSLCVSETNQLELLFCKK